MFGLLIAALTPPLRGPDETAHFLRAYGLAQGDIVPATTDADGRKGLVLPARILRDFSYFEQVRVSEKNAAFSYRRVVRDYLARADLPAPVAAFVRYEGSEGYSPAAYLPQVVGAWIADRLGLGFLGTFYLMRLTGLIGITAIIAAAVARAGPLGWAFCAIALLPSALYGRAVVSADGMAFATALMGAAFFLRLLRRADEPPAMRGLWLVLSVLTKPPNIVFVLPELMRRPLARHLRTAVLVVLPAIAAAGLWAHLGSADVAAWRLADLYGLDARQFEPAAKIALMLSDPLAFPRSLAGTLAAAEPDELWTQAIGVLGLFDTVLTPLAYPFITVLMVFSLFARLGLDAAGRRQAIAVALVTVVTYALAIATIFYLVWTPIGSPDIWGIQGRYFVPVMAFAAIALAALVDRAPPPWLTATFALASAGLSGVASIDAIIRADWGY